MVNDVFKDLLSIPKGTIVTPWGATKALDEHYIGTLLVDGDNLLVQGVSNQALVFSRYLLGDVLGAYLVGWRIGSKVYFIATQSIVNNVYVPLNGLAIEVPNPNDKYLFGVPVNLQQI